jgi:hypothetical protein
MVVSFALKITGRTSMVRHPMPKRHPQKRGWRARRQNSGLPQKKNGAERFRAVRVSNSD